MAQDISYFVSGYIDETYFVYTADAESSIVSASTLTATAKRIVFVTDNMSATSYLYGPTSDLNAIATVYIQAPANPIILPSIGTVYYARTYAVLIGNING